jgi:DNA-binding GntR family transcriptional regulator
MAKLEYRTLNDRAYAALKKGLISGQFKPGQVLTIRQLASRYGISATPVREALQRLVREGLVEVRPRSGTRVAPLDLQRVEEGMLVREALEVQAMQATARRITATDLHGLRTLNDELDRAARAGDVAAYLGLDDRFHAELLRLSGYPSIPTIIDEVNAHLDRVRALSGALPDRMTQSAQEHRRLLDALAQRDGAAAGAALRDHLQASWQTVRRLVAALPR